MIDLHTHSTASDGTFSPRDLLYYAKEQGLSVLALTDHDTIDGIDEAREAAMVCRKISMHFKRNSSFCKSLE